MKNKNGKITELVDAAELTKARLETYNKDQVIQKIVILLDEDGRKDVLDKIVANQILTKQQIDRYLHEMVYI